MGANTFTQVSNGKTAQEAFGTAVEAAQHENDHGGYTGTIAEKGGDGFTMITPDGDTSDWTQNTYENWAHELTVKDDPRVADKWGPAGCTQIGDTEFLFFGWAAS